MLHPLRVGRKARVGDPVGPLQRLAQAGIGALRRGDEREVDRVGAAVHVGRCGVGRAIARAPSHLAQLFVLHGQWLHHPQQRLCGGQVHFHALGVRVAAQPRHFRGDREGAEQSGDGIADGEVAVHGGTVRLAGQVGEPTHRFEDAGEAGTLTVGTGLAEAREPDHHQPRICAMQGLDVQAPSRHGAGAEVLHQHVEGGQHAQQQLAALGLAHIQRDAAFAAVGHFPPQRRALLDRLHVAQRVAAIGQLELDHVGAMVCAHRGTGRAGQHGRHVEDAHAAEGAAVRGSCGQLEGPR
ncbi:hypothetical protein D3C87_1282840 [compost metagenome]